MRARTVYGDPFHHVDVLGEHDDSFEVSLDEGSIGKGATEEERFSV